MPYVEVWVEPEVDRRQTAAMKAIIRVCRDIASSGILPTHDADALDRAIGDILKEFPQDDPKTEFPIDRKYAEWREKARAAQQTEAHDAP